jgi:hypothetical protein
MKKKWHWVIAGILIVLLIALSAYLYWRTEGSKPPALVIRMVGMAGSNPPYDLPEYEITIYDNGAVTYAGWAHVARIGRYTTTISQDSLRELLAEADRLGFFEMSDPPRNLVDDVPSMIISITSDRKSHTVTVHTYTTPELVELRNKIVEMTNTGQWIDGQTATTQAATVQAQTEASSQRWREDLRFLVEYMQQTHPNLFFRISPEDFEQAVRRVNEQIPHLTDKQIILELMQLMAIVEDGHTFLPPLQEATGFHLYPLRLYLFSDGLFVIDAQEPYEEAIGARVVQVGNIDVDRVYEMLTPYISHDNESTIKLIAPDRFLIPEILEALGIIDDMQQPGFVLENRVGERFTLNPAPIELDEYREWVFPSNAYRPSLETYEELTFLSDLPERAEPLYLRTRYDEVYWFAYLEESQTLFIQYNFVAEYSPTGGTLAQFSQTLAEVVAAQPVDRVVVDLRHNPGGDNTTYRPLLDLLTTNEAINQPGKLFTIIGRKTFSAATDFATELEGKSATIFVGEPTGGRPNYYGDARPGYLPHSRLVVNVSTRFWQKSQAEDTRPWIEPHFAVGLSSEDYFEGRDPVLEFILNYEPQP